MPRGRPRKDAGDNDKVLKQKFWIFDSIWEEPIEVKIVRRQVNEHGEFLCWDSYEVEARGANGKHFLHQIFKRDQLFPTKKALCEYYIKKFKKFMED